MVEPQAFKEKLPTCPFCGASVDHESNFCSTCGTILKVPDSTRDHCPQCGAQVSESQSVCFVCNWPLEEGMAPTVAAPAGDKGRRPSPLSKIYRFRAVFFAVGIGVLVVFSLILFWLAQSKHGQQQTKPAMPMLEKETGLSATMPSPLPILEAKAPYKPEQKVEEFLNNFRSTQLQKELERYLAFYSPNFPDLQNKRETMSKFWANYDYIKLDYKILEIKPISENTLFVKVSWDARIKNKKNGTINKLTNAYNLTLKFEENNLLIIKVKSIESTPG
jgi:hypothetical protein